MFIFIIRQIKIKMSIINNKVIEKALNDFFGFKNFKGNQLNIIKNLLSGKDTFVIKPTGFLTE